MAELVMRITGDGVVLGALDDHELVASLCMLPPQLLVMHGEPL